MNHYTVQPNVFVVLPGGAGEELWLQFKATGLHPGVGSYITQEGLTLEPCVVECLWWVCRLTSISFDLSSEVCSLILPSTLITDAIVARIRIGPNSAWKASRIS